MISSITGGSNYYQQMAAIQQSGQSRPNPFEENDADGDGFLNIEELGAFVEKMNEKTGQSVTAQDMLDRLDTDGDAQVSEAEFEAGRPKGPPPEMMGGDSGGRIQTLMAKSSGSEDSEDSGYFDSLDTNEDGVVDAEELKAGLLKLLEAYQKQDANAYGSSDTAQTGVDLQV